MTRTTDLSAGWKTSSGTSGGVHVGDYDGEYRLQWVTDQLLAGRSDGEAISCLVRRLADPREYPNETGAAQRVAQQLNTLLAIEGYRITYTSGRPVINACEPTLDAPDVPTPLLVPLAMTRLHEAATCREHGAHLAAVIPLGSLLEAILLDAVRSDHCARPTARTTHPNTGGHWTS